jgi:hypothetical protein
MAKKKKAAKKKAPKRKARKKAVAKKAKKKKPAKGAKVYIKIKSNILGEAPQEFEFYLQDGRKLKSVYELVDALESMSDDLFKQHVSKMHNDFSNWIKDVFKEPNVAKEIEKVHDRIEAQKVLIRRLIEAAKKSSK